MSILRVVGHVNNFDREATPISTGPVFEKDGKVFSVSGDEIIEIEREVWDTEQDYWYISLPDPIAVTSIQGRILIHENVFEEGCVDQDLIRVYVESDEEELLRSSLYDYYLHELLETVMNIENSAIKDDLCIKKITSLLERIARSKPNDMLARATLAVLSYALGDRFGFDVDRDEIIFMMEQV